MKHYCELDWFTLNTRVRIWPIREITVQPHIKWTNDWDRTMVTHRAISLYMALVTLSFTVYGLRRDGQRHCRIESQILRACSVSPKLKNESVVMGERKLFGTLNQLIHWFEALEAPHAGDICWSKQCKCNENSAKFSQNIQPKQINWKYIIESVIYQMQLTNNLLYGVSV